VVSGGLLRSSPSTLTATVSTATPLTALVAASGLNDRAWLEAKLPFGHDGFPRPQSLLDDDFFVHTLARHDWPLFDRGVRFDNEYVLTLLAGLNRFAGHNRGLGQPGEMQADARELPGPQAAIGIVDGCF
jgi:hypothetical protein